MMSVAVLGLAACSESPLAPDYAGAPSFIANHGTIAAPGALSSSVSPAGAASNVQISWNWSDAEDSWDLVSFKLLRDGVEVTGDIPNSKPYTAGLVLNRSHTDYGVANGTYEYCVEVMAKYKFAPGAEVTNHNRNCVTVTVGASYSITILGGNAANGTAGKNSNTFTLEYQFLLNGTVITDCAMAPAVTLYAPATQHQHNCDPTTGKRLISFINPAKGTAASYVYTWTYNATTIHTFNLTTS